MKYHVKGNEQEVFNRICKHFSKQKKSAVDENGRCLYRAPNNLKCAIGCLFPDRVYKNSFEDNDVNYLQEVGIAFDANTIFLDKMQETHDNSADLEDLKSNLLTIAKAYDLDTTAIDLIKEWNEAQ